MTKRERVMAALRGEPVDRVPVSLWLHNFATENSAETLAAETLRLARRFDWDFLKPQSRAQCFAEMWGLRYAPSQRARDAVHGDAGAAATARRPAPARARRRAERGARRAAPGAAGDPRRRWGPRRPIIWTVFSPLMVLPFLLAGGRARPSR